MWLSPHPCSPYSHLGLRFLCAPPPASSYPQQQKPLEHKVLWAVIVFQPRLLLQGGGWPRMKCIPSHRRILRPQRRSGEVLYRTEIITCPVLPGVGIGEQAWPNLAFGSFGNSSTKPFKLYLRSDKTLKWPKKELFLLHISSKLLRWDAIFWPGDKVMQESPSQDKTVSVRNSTGQISIMSQVKKTTIWSKKTGGKNNDILTWNNLCCEFWRFALFTKSLFCLIALRTNKIVICATKKNDGIITPFWCRPSRVVVSCPYM